MRGVLADGLFDVHDVHMSNKEAPQGYVRLHINVAADTMAFLRQSAQANGTTITETVRRAASVLQFVEAVKPEESLAIVTEDAKGKTLAVQKYVVVA